jgi:hypothetical protein
MSVLKLHGPLDWVLEFNSTLEKNDTFMRSTFWILLLMAVAQSGWTQAADDAESMASCRADFSANPDLQNPLKIQFQDRSIGQIAHWQWSFGDGVTSTLQNPVHTYLAEGTYIVCLTVYNSDTSAFCHDAVCLPVTVRVAAACHASFKAELDSMGHTPNTFKFINQSTGDPLNYLWKFDDGTTQNSRNAIHRFTAEGDHEVCLYITREEHGTIVCRDSVCQTITTARYFNLGGHLFTGTFPINNPVSTGDTGLAYLYRKNGNNLILFDFTRFTNLGYYAFPNVLNGQYVVKAALAPGSVNHSRYFPGYFSQELTWKGSSVLDLSDSSMFTSHIYLLPTQEIPSGPGKIKGKVVPASKTDNPTGIPFSEVILYDAKLNPLSYAISDESGKFELNNLPFGAYNLYVDFPGKYSRITAVWLDESTPMADGLNLELFDHDVTGLPEVDGSAIFSSGLFPNPVGSVVNLIVHPDNVTPLKFEILAITGLPVYSESRVCQPGTNMITIPVSQIPAGIYLFTIKSINGSVLSIKKMVK